MSHPPHQRRPLVAGEVDPAGVPQIVQQGFERVVAWVGHFVNVGTRIIPWTVRRGASRRHLVWIAVVESPHTMSFAGPPWSPASLSGFASSGWARVKRGMTTDCAFFSKGNQTPWPW